MYRSRLPSSNGREAAARGRAHERPGHGQCGWLAVHEPAEDPPPGRLHARDNLDQDSPFAEQVDNDGHTFIDRNPEDFKIILDFLRRGQVLYDAANFTRAQLDSLRAEADYYMLPGLVTQIDDALATISLEGKPPTRYWQGLKVAEGHYATDKHNIWWIFADEDEDVHRKHLLYAPVDSKLTVGAGGFAHADQKKLFWHNGEQVTSPMDGIKNKKVNWQSFTVNGVSPWGHLA